MPVDAVKLLVVERNGVDLEDYEEINLTASAVPFSSPGFSSDNVQDAIIESTAEDEDNHSAQFDIDISDEVVVADKKQMFVFQELFVTGSLLVNGLLIVGE